MQPIGLQYFYRDHPSGPHWGDINDWMHIHNGAAWDELINENLHHRDSDGSVSIVYVP